MPMPALPAIVARGLAHRGATNLVLLLVAVVAAGAAAVGPMYYVAAQSSILRDSFDSAQLLERGLEASQQGDLNGLLDGLATQLAAATDAALPDAAVRRRLLATPTEAVEGSAFFAELAENPAVVWRTDYCEHLQLTAGRCSTATDEVIISDSLARQNGWQVGQRLTPPGWASLLVTGIYRIPDVTNAYWFGRAGLYFPAEAPTKNQATGSGTPADALFTPQASLGGAVVPPASGSPQGTAVVDQLVNVAAVQGADLPRLIHALNVIKYQFGLLPAQPALASAIPAVVDGVHASWRSLAVPMFLVTVQLVVLVWLLMFLVVRDAVDARGREVALMRLRGRRGVRLLGFALAEPVTLLVVALPLGLLFGRLACSALSTAVLRPGIAVPTPALAWAAAGAATLGGLVATVMAGWRTLRRSVVDQWQHTSREAARRSWAVEAVVLTAAAAGTVVVIFGGHVTSVKQGSLGLLVPGLFGLSLAVLAARALPAVCRRLFGLTRRHGGLGAFLAVRHMARRTNSARTVIILVTAFALSTFALASWGVGSTNRTFVAEIGVGAPTVLDVLPPSGVDLGGIVDRIDPGGTQATVVDRFLDPSGGGKAVLGVDPQRFARVATWRNDFASRSLADLTQSLAPAAAPPVPLDGDQIRVRLTVSKLSQPGLVLSAFLASPEADGPLYNEIGVLDPATSSQTSSQTSTQTLTASLSGCPCTLTSLGISASPGDLSGDEVTGAVTLIGIDEHTSSGWASVPNLNAVDQWRVSDGTDTTTTDGLARTPDGLTWPLDFPNTSMSTLVVADRPDPLPAIASLPGVTSGTQFQITGLDDNAVTIAPIATAIALPGAPNGGVIVDRVYAERAASGILSDLTTRQVWVASGATKAISAGLVKAGVQIVDTQRAADQASRYDREGPGLASLAFVSAAVAAATLAAAGAIAGLVTAARRRRFEYAALRAAGARSGSLYVGLLIEQAGVLIVGAVVGAIAGVLAAVLAVRSVPEFVTAPTLPLTYSLPIALLGWSLAAALAALLLSAAVTSRLVLAGARADQLREAEE